MNLTEEKWSLHQNEHDAEGLHILRNVDEIDEAIVCEHVYNREIADAFLALPKMIKALKEIAEFCDWSVNSDGSDVNISPSEACADYKRIYKAAEKVLLQIGIKPQ